MKDIWKNIAAVLIWMALAAICGLILNGKTF